MDTITWKDVILGSFAVLNLVVGWFIGSRKRQADVHKTETDTDKAEFETFDLEMTRFLDLLGRIQAAHKQSMADDDTIAQLRRDIEDCLNGHKDWIECRDDAVQFLEIAESELQGGGLLPQISILKARLTALSMGEDDPVSTKAN